MLKFFFTVTAGASQRLKRQFGNDGSLQKMKFGFQIALPDIANFREGGERTNGGRGQREGGERDEEGEGHEMSGGTREGDDAFFWCLSCWEGRRDVLFTATFS